MCIMQVSPGKSGPKPTAHQSDVVNDPLESVRRKAEKAFKVLSRRNSMTPRDSSCATTMPQSASSSGIKWCENNVMWSSLSSSLVRHGKEAMKQRDVALQAVLNGLLEATATEKLIKCLSKYSELQYDKDDDPKELIEVPEILSRARSSYLHSSVAGQIYTSKSMPLFNILSFAKSCYQDCIGQEAICHLVGQSGYGSGPVTLLQPHKSLL